MNAITVIKLGGSLIVPRFSEDGGINVPFLRAFRRLILAEMKKGTTFVVVAGGGRTNRAYNLAAKSIARVQNADLDWIGIYATRLNAYLLGAIFQGHVYPWVIDGEPSRARVMQMRTSRKKLFLAAGWLPGCSTDDDTVKLAEIFGAQELIKAGDVPFVYEKDPDVFPHARAFREISWQDYKRIIPATWEPRLSTPFDPVATRRAEKLGLTVKILDGRNLKNLKNALEKKPFEGTVIQ